LVRRKGYFDFYNAGKGNAPLAVLFVPIGERGKEAMKACERIRKRSSGGGDGVGEGVGRRDYRI